VRTPFVPAHKRRATWILDEGSFILKLTSLPENGANLFAGLVAGRLADLPPAPLFQSVAMTVGIVGIVGILASPVVRRMMHGVK
jgi:hypothetical protein